VGSTLRDLPDDKNSENAVSLVTNFESQLSAGEFAEMYKNDGLQGGHVIMLGADPASHAAALEALKAYPGKLVQFSSPLNISDNDTVMDGKIIFNTVMNNLCFN
jgi:phosphoribosylformimino-5-aminoimidazole carboxamide ribotide isomerase